MRPNLIPLVNLALRGVTLASKFLLLFFLARFLNPSDLAVYGLITASVGYSLYLLGLDFYTFSSREILKYEHSDWGRLLRDHAVVSIAAYSVLFPLFGLAFAAGFLPWHLAGWFFVLVILEHATQELDRLMIVISEQLLASVVLFLRSGFWTIAVAITMFLDPESRDLNHVFGAWSLGAAAGLGLGIYRLHHIGTSGWSKRINWQWIFEGLKIALPFFVATLALRALFTLDRYWLQALGGLDVLAAYVIFMGICSALITVLDAAVFAFSYPTLISAHVNKDATGFRKGMAKLFWRTIVLSAAFTIVAAVLIDPLLIWLGKPLYMEKQELFRWILFSNFLYALSMVPHFGLYAQGHDRPIINSHIASFVAFAGLTWLFSTDFPLLAVPFSLCISLALLMLWKSWVFVQLTPKEYCLFARSKSLKPTKEADVW